MRPAPPKDRTTITVDPSVLERVRHAVESGATTSVSAFFEWAALRALDADAAFDLVLDEILEETGGPLTPDEIEATERALGLKA